MARLASVQVLGNMEGGGKHYTGIRLNLTVREWYDGGSSMPIVRGIVRNELSPMSAAVVDNGDYVLRFFFNGRQEEHHVHVEDGVLLSGAAA